MPISRPLLIALVAAVLALVGFYAMQSMGGSSDSDSADTAAPVVPADPAPAPDPAPKEPAGKPADEPASVAKVDTAKPDEADPKTDRAERKAAVAKAAARRRAREERLGMPLAVARALDGRKTVVLYFSGSPSADDRAAARAVAGLRDKRGVAVFADGIGRVGRYRAVVGELGIAQAPAVVIVDRGRAARVVQGYIDPTTLAQDVADTR